MTVRPAGEGGDLAEQLVQIERLGEVGVSVQAGGMPLHRAVRARSPAAVAALLSAGADPRAATGKAGSTPLHLAVQNTGKSNSGSEASKDEQGRVIVLLLRHGASPTDVDAKGKTVAAAASSDWIRRLLDTK